jgi:hypothetical protein
MQNLDAVQRVWLAAAAISALKALETTDSILPISNSRVPSGSWGERSLAGVASNSHQ